KGDRTEASWAEASWAEASRTAASRTAASVNIARRRRSRLLRVLGGLVIVWVAITHDLGLQPIAILNLIDRQVYDGRQLLREAVPDPRIVIVDIDERSLAEEGRWPWPRERIADLLDAIFEQGG